MKKLQSIQAFRAFASILILIQHANLISQEKFTNNFIPGSPGLGVNSFFALSGFILVFIHIKELGKSYKAKIFFIKRFFRIYPLYWLVSLLILPMFFLGLGSVKQFDGDWLYILKSFILFPQEKLPLLSPGWTLTHEVYFYIVFGLLVYFWNSKIVRGLFFIIVLGTIYKATLDFNSDWFYKYRTYQTILDSNFMLSFIFSRYNLLALIGGLFGYFAYKRVNFDNNQSHPNILLHSKSVFFFIVSLILTLLIIPPSNLFGVDDRIVTLVWQGIMVSLLFLVCTTVETKNNYQQPYVLTFLGDASYSVFLFHYPLLLGISKVIFALGVYKLMGSFFAMLTITILSIALSSLFFVLIEKPLSSFTTNYIKKVHHPN
ncbi:acyltransferase family protein [Cyanobacterium aponinum]|uniref:Acyltransferase family protein n=1 Tax=Cyanobacterium aponinum 0216 TaxID=2676140 RepID=A0A844GQQ0_9CHRO|nr:acyltransferase [Cyanobacterium aponinum]MTF38874.1 acyltransferase family protein [Cyanobacterium aponinum 0216]